MSKYMVAALLAGTLALPTTAGAAAPAKVHRVKWRVLCQLKHVPPNPGTVAGIKALCNDRANVIHRAHASNIVYGSCGESWMFNGKLMPGWVAEWYGVNLNAPIDYGGALISWYNFSQRQYRNALEAPVWGSVDPYTWDSWHNAYTHGGLIGSWLDAAAVTIYGDVCMNFYNQPYSFAWV